MHLPPPSLRLAVIAVVAAALTGCTPATDGPSTAGTGGSGSGGATGGTSGATGGRGGGGATGGSGGSSTTGGAGGTTGGGPSTGGSSGSAGTSGTAGASGSGGGGSGGSDGTGGSGGSSGVDASVPGDGSAPGEAGGPPAPGSAPVPSAACAGGAMMPGPNGNQTFMANGKNRSFIVRMPNGYDGKKPTPMLFMFHGAGGGASGFEGGVFGGLSRMAADRAIRVFPQAFGGNTWARDENDDVLYMDALMEWMKTRVCYDTARIFATGQSSGAYFSHRWACDRGDVVRAVGTNSGGQRRERALDCKSPVSAWVSTGAADDPGHVMGTRQARDAWAKLAGCSLTGATPTPPAPCVAQPGCREGYAVHYCQHGGGHAVPGYAIMGIFNFLFNSKI